MLLGTVAGRKASCVLCGWDADYGNTNVARQKLAEHLHLEHRRVLITQTEGKDRSEQPWFKFEGPRYVEKEWDKP